MCLGKGTSAFSVRSVIFESSAKHLLGFSKIAHSPGDSLSSLGRSTQFRFLDFCRGARDEENRRRIVYDDPDIENELGVVSVHGRARMRSPDPPTGTQLTQTIPHGPRKQNHTFAVA